MMTAGSAMAVPVVVHDTITGTTVSSGGFYVGTVNFGSFVVTGIIGQQFHASADGAISTLQLRSFADTPRTLTFDLHADVGGFIGPLLESFSVPVGASLAFIGTATGPGTVALEAGEDYWIVSNPAAQGYWYRSSASGSVPERIYVQIPQTQAPNPTLGGGTYSSYSTTEPLGLRVVVETAAEAATATPAPPSLALLLAGVALLGVARPLAERAAGRRTVMETSHARG